jgi:predicted nucleotidyltransferase
MLTLPAATLEALNRVARSTRGLDVLLLHGSRARGVAGARSDWDFGYLGTDELDADGLIARLVETLGSDRVDLADLARASGLLRFRAARDGYVLYESTAGVADHFRLTAATFWCDAVPALRRGYDAVLAELES